jgi:hypothetical protein
MKCQKCKCKIPRKEETYLNGKVLCRVCWDELKNNNQRPSWLDKYLENVVNP